MNLQEKFDASCGVINETVGKRDKLVAAIENAEKIVKELDVELVGMTKSRDEYHAMLGVVPPKPVPPPAAQLMENRQAVFAAFRKIYNAWIAPMGLAVLSGVNEETTASILRRAAKLNGVPVEHNGRKGRASKYRWLGDKL